MASNKKYVHDRKYIRGQISKLHNNSVNNLATFTPILAMQELAKLNTFKDKIKILDASIQTDMYDDTNPNMDQIYDAELDACQDYDNKILIAIVNFENIIKPLGQQNSPGLNDQNSGGGPQLKRPSAPLPKYGDKSTISLVKFFAQLESITSKYSYSSFELFVILREQLSGRSLTLLNSLEIDNQDYDSAKDLLLEALANPNLQKFETISKLVNLTCNSNKDLYVYVSELRNLPEEVKQLKIDGDSITQYCFLKSMPANLRNALVQITNTNFPSVDEIMNNSFKAIERVKLNDMSFCKNSSAGQSREERSDKSLHKVSNENIFATSIKTERETPKYKENDKFKKTNKEPECGLCKKYIELHNEDLDFKHSPRICPQFNTVDEKLKFLKENGGCDKCGYFHSDVCRFHFYYKCPAPCNEYHFSYLCKKAEKSVEEREVQSTSMTWTFSASTSSSSLIPTFSCQTEDGLVVNGFKDSGSTTTMYSEKFVKKLTNYKVIKSDLKVTVNGFNGKKVYKSSLISVKMIFQDKIFFVEGLVVP